MIETAIFIGLPLIVFVLAAILPEGWAAMTGIGLALLLCVAFWVARALVVAPLFTGEAASDGLTTALGVLVSAAVALGALVQLLRTRLPLNRRGWVYPALVVFTILLAGLPALRLLGL